MVKFCVVPGCGLKQAKDLALPFHLFPKDLVWYHRWRNAIKRSCGPMAAITTNSCVCGNHFQKDDYFGCKISNELIKRQKLKRDAIPSLFEQVGGLDHETHRSKQRIPTVPTRRPTSSNFLKTEDQFTIISDHNEEQFECYEQLEVTGGSDKSDDEIEIENENENKNETVTVEIYEDNFPTLRDQLTGRDAVLVNLDLSKPSKMLPSTWKDADGFKLQFEANCPDNDKTFFVSQYPKIDNVSEKRLHCTTCDIHIGTAPIAEKIVRTHEVLGVTQCNKCHAFYNSGEFGKGEDGSEYYCRWCGQGGEVFCCSSCPFVFCNKCIRTNLSNSYVKEIEDNDDWSCFVCNRDILKNQRANHWALRNFMNKQLEKIQKNQVKSEDELNQLLNEDSSNCCPRKKRKSIMKVIPAPVKRPINGFTGIQPPAKKPALTPMPQNQQTRARIQPAPASRSSVNGKSNSEIVCTPDISGMMSGDTASIDLPTSSAPPPPLVMRANQRASQFQAIRPAPPAVVNPIFHNVNGFQIDLNHAARQEIFRLPNGKLIQVRKQQSAAPMRASGLVNAILQPRSPQFTIRPAAPPVFNNPRQPYRPRARMNTPQQRFTFSEGRIAPVPQTAAPAQPAAAPQTQSTIFTQQNGSISVARAPQPDTPFGKSKSEFEDKIISGLEICQHTINKMITLTNSTSFKTSKSFSDLKELYIHLQYLFTYTSGKFKTLQDGLITSMESLAVHDAALKEHCDVDELEIVEEKQDVIEVMSDEDDDYVGSTKAKIKDEKHEEDITEESESENVVDPAEIVSQVEKPIAVIVKKPLLKHIQYTSKDVPLIPEVVEKNLENPTDATDILIGMFSEDTCESIKSTISEKIEKDKKLQNKVVVKAERLENDKSPVVKEFLLQLKLRKEQELSSNDQSREATPEVLDEFTGENTAPTLSEGSKNDGDSDEEISNAVSNLLTASLAFDIEVGDVISDTTKTLRSKKKLNQGATTDRDLRETSPPGGDELTESDKAGDKVDDTVEELHKIDSILPDQLMEINEDEESETTTTKNPGEKSSDNSDEEVNENLSKSENENTIEAADQETNIDDKEKTENISAETQSQEEISEKTGVEDVDKSLSDDVECAEVNDSIISIADSDNDDKTNKSIEEKSPEVSKNKSTADVTSEESKDLSPKEAAPEKTEDSIFDELLDLPEQSLMID